MERKKEKELVLAVSEDEIFKWRKKRHDLRQKLAKTEEELEIVEKKLQAVFVLLEGKLREPGHVSHHRKISRHNRPRFIRDLHVEEKIEPTTPVTEAVLKILKEFKRPLQPIEVRRELQERGYKESRLGSYLYTVLKRLQERDEIEKLKRGYVYKRKEKIEAPEDNEPSDASKEKPNPEKWVLPPLV